jgi:ABC-type glycerol-3-phosphate transport system permease component
MKPSAAAAVAGQWDGEHAGAARRAVVARTPAMKIPLRTLALVFYLALLLLPIYWMLNMSLRDNNDIMTAWRSIRKVRRSTTTRRS